MASTTAFSPAPLAIGDLQGCQTQLRQLLVAARCTDDTPLWFVGDLVNRGPNSLGALRDIIALGTRAVAVMGNHELHLLSVAAGIRQKKKGDTIGEILAAPDAADLLDWVRHLPLAHFANNTLMVHAGVLPQWDIALALELAEELQRALRAADWQTTLAGIYAPGPSAWRHDLSRQDRLRVICNAFTRLRFCSTGGEMDFSMNGGPDSAPSGFWPWFDAPGRRSTNSTIVFGHWAALGLIIRDNLVGLDSGCVWGNRLSGVRLTADASQRSLTQVECAGCRDTPQA